MCNRLFSFVFAVVLVAMVTVNPAFGQQPPQPVPQPGQVVVFLPNPPAVATPPLAVPAAPTPTEKPLDERLKTVTQEYQKVIDSGNQLRATLGRRTNDPLPAITFGGNGSYLIGGLLILLLIGVLIWALVRRRNDNQVAVEETDDDFVVHHPRRITAEPVELHFPAPRVGPAPAVPAARRRRGGASPAVAPAPVGTPCPGCATPKPTLVARFCTTCGHALPTITLVLLLFGFGRAAIAQTVITAQPCTVNGVVGQCFNLPTPQPAAAPAPSAPAPRPAAAPAAPAMTPEQLAAVVTAAVKAALPSVVPQQAAPPAALVSFTDVAVQAARAETKANEALAKASAVDLRVDGVVKEQLSLREQAAADIAAARDRIDQLRAVVVARGTRGEKKALK